MTPLEAAKRLVEDGPPEWHEASQEWMCGFCYARLFDPTDDADNEDTAIYESFTHDPDCPVLALPRIVAALEAADRLIDRGGEEDRAEWIALAEALDFPLQGEKETVS